MTKFAFRTMTLSLGCILLATLAGAQEQSLADQVNAAKGRSGQQQTDSVMGRTVGGDYHNDVLGFQIHQFPGWTSMSRGQMNVDEAIGREALGLHAGLSADNYRVFGMHDEEGSNIMVLITPYPAGASTDPAIMKLSLVQVARTQLPDAKMDDETALLDDAAHHFAGLRLTHTVGERQIVQSMQILPVKGYAVTITVTGGSAEQLQSMIAQLRTSLQWNSGAQ